MSKKIKCAVLTFALASVVAISSAMAGCTIKTNHPKAEITVKFNNVSYAIDYTLYRNMYPRTVQHFIELADTGYYNNMIVHNYNTSTDWFTGAYSYNGDESLSYETAAEGTNYAEYLEKNSKEQEYYNLASDGTLTPTVYKTVTYDEKGNAIVNDADKLATLIGEFSSNNHVVENNGLTAGLGALKMYYYEKDDSNKKAAIVNSFDQVLIHDYKYNCATSVFSMQIGTSTSYSETNYCVFAKLANDSAQDKLQDLLDAISDYITDNSLASKFTTSVTTNVDLLDAFAKEGGVEATFSMTSVPLVIESVKIKKY